MRELLDCGAAINALTASDSGWDLHLHLPERPMHINAEPAGHLNRTKLSWRLAGRTAHVQVKRTTRSSVTLKVGTVRGWLTGTRAGTPTFLVMVRDKPDGTTSRLMATPAALQHWLDSNEHRGEATEHTLGSRAMMRFDAKTFGWSAHMWCLYPEVLLTHPVVERAAHRRQFSDAEVVSFTAELIAGCLGHDGIDMDAGTVWWTTGSWGLAQSSLQMLKPNLNALAAQALEDLIQAEVSSHASPTPGRNRGEDWRGTGLPVSYLGGDPRSGASAFHVAHDVIANLHKWMTAVRGTGSPAGWWTLPHVSTEDPSDTP